ncbi:hypothetical protein AQUSIP_14450 [Aquicella siphonis]|uniref:Uncharacterized protein n=1 Tax=Aquicella siphonis TaxID=254247 RepID=A0A5E4PGH9_9COXI|nr:hypothetical protein AQUSIP_14450 [Aquicella siphonis]
MLSPFLHLSSDLVSKSHLITGTFQIDQQKNQFSSSLLNRLALDSIITGISLMTG